MLDRTTKVDLVYENDKVISQTTKENIYLSNLNNYRKIFAFFLSDEHKVWATIRSDSKKFFANSFDASISGHVMSGENYKHALYRKAKSNFGINIAKYKFDEVIKLTPYNSNSPCFIKVYRIFSNDEPDFYDISNISRGFWVYPEELLVRINFGEKVRPGLADAIYNVCIKL